MWDWLIVLLVLYSAILVPIQFAFAPPWADSPSFTIVDTVVDIMFWLDFGACLCQGHVDKWGVLVTDKG